MFKKVALIIVIAGFMFSCKEEGVENSSSMLNSLSTDEYELPFVLSQYDTTVSGKIEITEERIKINISDTGQSSNYRESIRNSVHAVFYDSSGTGSVFAGNLTVNNTAIDTFPSVNYWGWGSENNANNLNVHIDGSPNHIYKNANQYFAEIDTNISFNTFIEITSHQYDDNIDKTNDLTINWSGTAPSHYVKIQLSQQLSNKVSEVDSIQVGDSFGSISFFTDNDGSHTISSSELSALQSDKYKLSVTSYTPKYINMPNNEEVVVIGSSKHQFSVNLN